MEFSLRISRRSQPCQPLDFKLLVPRTEKEEIYVVLSQQVCGDLLWQPYEVNTAIIVNS